MQLSAVSSAHCATPVAAAAEAPPRGPSDWAALQRAHGLDAAAVPRTIAARRAELQGRLCGSLGIACPPTAEAGAGANSSAAAVAQHALANLLGSVTLFHGRQVVAAAAAADGGPGAGAVESPPHALVTGVPSRSFFPRGFLWVRRGEGGAGTGGRRSPRAFHCGAPLPSPPPQDEGFHLLIASQVMLLRR